MEKEDIEFLKSLQNEMLTQETVSQANPRFWVVMQSVRDYWVDDNIDGICIYNKNDAENVFEGDLEKLADWIRDNFETTKCEYNNGCIQMVYEDEEYSIDSITEIRDFFEEYSTDQYSICHYRDRDEIAKDTMFFTIRECREHIKRNHYHYKKPRTYAMTAWRSPQISKLYDILEKTNWDSCEDKEE